MSFSELGAFLGAARVRVERRGGSVRGVGSTTPKSWVSRVCTVGHACLMAEGQSLGSRSGCRNWMRQADQGSDWNGKLPAAPDWPPPPDAPPLLTWHPSSLKPAVQGEEVRSVSHWNSSPLLVLS